MELGGFPPRVSEPDRALASAQLKYDLKLHAGEIAAQMKRCTRFASVKTDCFVIEMDYRDMPLSITVSLSKEFEKRSEFTRLGDGMRGLITSPGSVVFSVTPNGTAEIVGAHKLADVQGGLA